LKNKGDSLALWFQVDVVTRDTGQNAAKVRHHLDEFAKVADSRQTQCLIFGASLPEIPPRDIHGRQQSGKYS
jgi:hypothetical protein